MARPRPIIIPSMSQNIEGPGQAQLGQALGQLIAAFAGRAMERGAEGREQEAFRETFPGLFPTQQVEAAGPRLPEGGVEQVGIAQEGAALAPAPQAEVVPQNIQALTKLLSLTPEGRAKGQQIAAQVGLQQAMPKAAGERKIIKDAEGFQRFVDTGERVFPTVAKPTEEPKSIFGAITDITKFTPESIKLAEKSGSRGDLVIKPEALQSVVTGKDKFNAEKDLRKEFTSESKTFKDVRDSFGRVQEAADAPTAAGDLSLIFNYMKMLDPGSVVRESEFANAATAQPILDRLGISFEAVSNVFEGKKLVDEARKDFVNQAKKLFNRQNKQHEQRVKTYTGIANRNKLDVDNVVLPLEDPLFEEESLGLGEALPEGAEVIGTSGGKEVIRVGGKTFIRE